MIITIEGYTCIDTVIPALLMNNVECKQYVTSPLTSGEVFITLYSRKLHTIRKLIISFPRGCGFREKHDIVEKNNKTYVKTMFLVRRFNQNRSFSTQMFEIF